MWDVNLVGHVLVLLQLTTHQALLAEPRRVDEHDHHRKGVAVAALYRVARAPAPRHVARGARASGPPAASRGGRCAATRTPPAQRAALVGGAIGCQHGARVMIAALVASLAPGPAAL